MNVARGPQNAVRFPRSARLLRRSDFERVYRGGKKHFSGSMTVFFLRRDPPQGGPRIGLTVGRVLGGAVVRNRIRRRLREAVRVHAAADMAPGNDYVIVGREELASAPFADIAAELSRRIRGRR